jgi:hypothetical protein
MIEDIDFSELKFAGRGMLDPGVYREIARCAARAEAQIVEVGAFFGAGTMAAAIGAPEGVRVRTIDKFGDARFGGAEQHVRHLKTVFDRFGVADKIDINVGTSEEFVASLDDGGPIGMLILDADGAINRDFRLFYDRLVDGAPIVIDDVRPDHVVFTYPGGRSVVFDQKHRLSALLTDLFEERGIIVRETKVKDTYFGRKSGDKKFAEAIDAESLIACYQKLSRGTAHPPQPQIEWLRRVVQARAPRLYMQIKRLFGKAAD